MPLRSAGLVRAAAVLVGLLSAQSLVCQDVVLRAEFWAESEPVEILPAEITDTAPKVTVPEEVVRSLLEEGRRVFSGMIWGFEFRYVPYDKARGVAEELEILPLGEIPWGDPRLGTGPTRLTGTQLRAYLEYRPDPSAAARKAAWENATYQSAQGRGSAPLAGGREARRTALDQAAKEALRELLRPVEKNKPREIRGVLAYDGSPRIVITGGTYTAILRIRVKVAEVRRYTVY
jgi:hypothetical protein